MRSILQFAAILAVLAVSPTLTSAFGLFGPAMFVSQNVAALQSRAVAVTNNARVSVRIAMLGRGGRARSKEEDLELTRAIIMKHVAGDIMEDVYDDSDDEVGRLQRIKDFGINIKDEVEDRLEKGQPLKKIKNVGRKIKSKLKDRLQKEEEDEVVEED